MTGAVSGSFKIRLLSLPILPHFEPHIDRYLNLIVIYLLICKRVCLKEFVRMKSGLGLIFLIGSLIVLCSFYVDSSIDSENSSVAKAEEVVGLRRATLAAG